VSSIASLGNPRSLGPRPFWKEWIGVSAKTKKDQVIQHRDVCNKIVMVNWATHPSFNFQTWWIQWIPLPTATGTNSVNVVFNVVWKSWPWHSIRSKSLARPARDVRDTNQPPRTTALETQTWRPVRPRKKGLSHNVCMYVCMYDIIYICLYHI
jgi:hypothetical protein